ncbi:hypothetical protein [Kitasatospora sp. GP82]|uniref:glycoside hydrolase family 16 protein n=1 Tax=Kitasatospora sp. GP82 TaxID=3035089 RepID=UPI00247428B2|nr:hypothetical protein [Kitasatospora sp. GP82]MDH6126167.1 hypothetical protein [Kitasatospora sp. GP82]
MAKVTQDYLSPAHVTHGNELAATLSVHSDVPLTVQTLTVAVRDPYGHKLDFAGADNVQITPTGYTLTTSSQLLYAGTYTVFGTYLADGVWHNLPSSSLVVATATGGGTGPTATRSLVWADHFDHPLNPNRWNSSTTSAYRYGTHHPDDDKLDWINPANVSVAGTALTFTARLGGKTLENGKQAWDTGLITTEGTREAFQLRTGDYLEALVQMPDVIGAWPALWTWRNGDNEVDTFEYHPDNPNLLEFSNHVRSGVNFYSNALAVAPLNWVTLGTLYGTDSVDWYVNGSKVYSDNTGVPSTWTAFLILNLSVAAGAFHQDPLPPGPITFLVDYIRVWR